MKFSNVSRIIAKLRFLEESHKFSYFRSLSNWKLKDLRISSQIAAKRNPEQEREAQEWIESILGKKFPPGETFEDVLKDGQVLCHLMNKLSPGSVPKINTSGGQFKMMENINL